MAAIPAVVLGLEHRGLESDPEEPRRYDSEPPAPVPEGYPYDRPIPEGGGGVMTPLPRHVVGGYWTYWGSPIRLTEIPDTYNTVFLFHATPVGGAPGATGAVRWRMPGDGRDSAESFVADLAVFRATRTAILTVGGSRASLDLSTRERAQVLLDSIRRIHHELGGFDGLDWNTYEGEQLPDTEQMIWVSRQLKDLYGQDFAITSPPTPWRAADVQACRAMVEAGVLDLVCPQYYDGPRLAEASYIIDSVDDWVRAMGDPGRVGVGFGVAHADDFSTIDTARGAWCSLSGRHPGLRGVYNWNLATDERGGWEFAREVGPLVVGRSVIPQVLPPVVPWPIFRRDAVHVVVPGETLLDIAAQHGIEDWREIADRNHGVVLEALRPGQVLYLPAAAMPPDHDPDGGT